MNKKFMVSCSIFFIAILIGVISILSFKSKENIETNILEGTVLSISNDKITVQDENDVIYSFYMQNPELNIGDRLVIEYTGLLDKSKSVQNNNIINYKTVDPEKDENGIPKDFLDDGIFKDYYVLAYRDLQKLSLEEKIGQVLLVRYPEDNAVDKLQKNKFGGYIFFEKDFKNLTKNQVQDRMKTLQKNANIPLLTAVDEEGGSVVRVSSNPNLVDEKFKSPSELYKEGGFEAIKNDTIKKSEVLQNLGLNVNLAPVVDVSTDPEDYMYKRALGEDTALTSTYASTVINASKKTDVSYVLKHFPGYGNNKDTHTETVTDIRSYEDIQKNDLPPFEAGIQAGAEAVLVSHNIVKNIDPDNPASLSSNIHNILRNELEFTGVIITDDLNMGAVENIDNATVKALLAGNDLIITSDYEKSIDEIKEALKNKTINESVLDKKVFKILAWKHYKGLMLDKYK